MAQAPATGAYRSCERLFRLVARAARRDADPVRRQRISEGTKAGMAARAQRQQAALEVL